MLNPNNPIHKALSRKFRDQICEIKTKSVWCCRNGEPGTEAELEALSSNYRESLISAVFFGKEKNALIKICTNRGMIY